MTVATEGTLTFFERESWPSHERPYELLLKPPSSDFPVCNYSVTRVPNVPIHNLRPLKEKLGVRATYIHECVIRQSDGKAGYSGSFGQPITNVHTDYTHDYALELIEQLTGDKKKAETIKKSRIQMLNIWKPLRGPLRSWPLALCDLQSLDREDVVTFDEVHATAVLESQQVVYNPSQKWYYLPNQEPNELIVFKSMDTELTLPVLQLLMDLSTTRNALKMNLRGRVLR
ncbi:hypothetical protein CEP53_010435 [Fusarium sp. AF-6]|nr:hypothetical protein CEP53_010435 [Fusarium sp. AF-6]